MILSPQTLARGFAYLDITYYQLWASYVALGGAMTPNEMRQTVDSDRCSDWNHNLIALALNEHYLDAGIQSFPVSYRP